MVDGAPGPESPDPTTSFDPRYIVERELGRGAMGRVFLARDLRLDRLVAIKSLAPGTHDARELLRLEHEARAAGSLNHPNIVAVHDIGLSGAGPFIVSEYVRGTTLRQRLDQGPLPLRDAVAYAVQLSQGLAAAHERGIVHRDLKPENLLLTDDGWLKILDFGIAKRVEPPLVGPALGGATPARGSPVVTPAQIPRVSGPAGVRGPGQGGPPAPAQTPPSPLLTSPGTIMGTVGYMAPEQVRGQPADARSDVFACGLILYEMLAGTRAFQGPTAAATSYAILRAEPRELPAGVPAELRETISRCLRKEPAERWQTARELSARLDELRPTGETPKVAPARGARLWLGAAALLLLAGASLSFALKGRTRPPPSFRQLTFHTGAVWTARFGPDGKKVFYGAAPDWKPPRIFSTEAGSPESSRLELPPAVLLAVSPSADLAVLLRSRFKLFDFGSGTLATVAASGAVAEIAPGIDYADFARDGTLAVVREEGKESRLEAPPGHRIAGSRGWISNPRFSPKGDLIAYIDHQLPLDDSGSVMVVDLNGNARVVAPGFASIFGLAWAPAGDEIWFSAGRELKATSAGGGEPQTAIRAASLDGRQRLLLRLAGDVWIQDVAADGRVLITEPNRRLDIGLMRGGGPAQEISWFDRSFLTDLSRDGSEVLFVVGGGATNDVYKLYLRKADGSPGTLLGEASGGSFSPDRKFAVAVPAIGAARLSLFPLSPQGQARTLDTGEVAVSRAWMFPDGQRVLLLGREPGRRHQLFVRGLDSAATRAISPEGISGIASVISPDGAWVASVDDKNQTVLYPVAGGASRELPGPVANERPFGWDDQGGLYVGAINDLPVHIDRIDPRKGERRFWRDLSPEVPGALGISRVLVARDGRSLAYNYATFTTHLYLLDGLR